MSVVLSHLDFNGQNLADDVEHELELEDKEREKELKEFLANELDNDDLLDEGSFASHTTSPSASRRDSHDFATSPHFFPRNKGTKREGSTAEGKYSHAHSKPLAASKSQAHDAGSFPVQGDRYPPFAPSSKNSLDLSHGYPYGYIDQNAYNHYDPYDARQLHENSDSTQPVLTVDMSTQQYVGYDTVGYGLYLQHDAEQTAIRPALEVEPSVESLAELRMLYNARGQKIEDLQKLVDEKEDKSAKEIRVLNHKLALLSGERDGLKTSVTQLNELLAEHKQEISDLRGQQQNDQNLMAKWRSDVDELQEKLAASDAAVDSLQQQIRSMNQSDSIARMRAQNESLLATSRQKHEQEILTLKEKLDDLQLALAWKTEDVNRYREMLDSGSSTSEVGLLKREVDRLKLENEQLSEQIRNLQSENAEFSTQLKLYEALLTDAGSGIVSSTPYHPEAAGAAKLAWADIKTPLSRFQHAHFKTPNPATTVTTLQTTGTSSPTTGAQSSMRDELVKALASNREKRKEISELRQQISELEQKNAVDSRAASESRKFSAEEKPCSMCPELKRSLEANKERLSQLEKALKDAEAKSASLQKDNAELNSNMAEMVRHFDKDKTETLEQQDKAYYIFFEESKRQLEAELTANFQMELAAMSSKLDHANEELLTTKNEYVNLCEHLKEVEATLTARLLEEKRFELDELKIKLELDAKEKLDRQESELLSRFAREMEKERQQLLAEHEKSSNEKLETALVLAKLDWTQEFDRLKASEIARAVNQAEEEWKAAHRAGMEADVQAKATLLKADWESQKEAELEIRLRAALESRKSEWEVMKAKEIKSKLEEQRRQMLMDEELRLKSQIFLTLKEEKDSRSREVEAIRKELQNEREGARQQLLDSKLKEAMWSRKENELKTKLQNLSEENNALNVKCKGLRVNDRAVNRSHTSILFEKVMNLREDNSSNKAADVGHDHYVAGPGEALRDQDLESIKTQQAIAEQEWLTERNKWLSKEKEWEARERELVETIHNLALEGQQRVNTTSPNFHEPNHDIGSQETDGASYISASSPNKSSTFLLQSKERLWKIKESNYKQTLENTSAACDRLKFKLQELEKINKQLEDNLLSAKAESTGAVHYYKRQLGEVEESLLRAKEELSKLSGELNAKDELVATMQADQEKLKFEYEKKIAVEVEDAVCAARALWKEESMRDREELLRAEVDKVRNNILADLKEQSTGIMEAELTQLRHDHVAEVKRLKQDFRHKLEQINEAKKQWLKEEEDKKNAILQERLAEQEKLFATNISSMRDQHAEEARLLQGQWHAELADLKEEHFKLIAELQDDLKKTRRNEELYLQRESESKNQLRIMFDQEKEALVSSHKQQVSLLESQLESKLLSQRSDLEGYYKQLMKKAMEVAHKDWSKDLDKKLNGAYERGMLHAASKDNFHVVEKLRVYYLETIEKITTDVMEHVRCTQENAARKIQEAALREKKSLIRKLKQKKKNKEMSDSDSVASKDVVLSGVDGTVAPERAARDTAARDAASTHKHMLETITSDPSPTEKVQSWKRSEGLLHRDSGSYEPIQTWNRSVTFLNEPTVSSIQDHALKAKVASDHASPLPDRLSRSSAISNISFDSEMASSLRDLPASLQKKAVERFSFHAERDGTPSRDKGDSTCDAVSSKTSTLARESSSKSLLEWPRVIPST